MTHSYLIEFFIRSCSALASDPCSPGTRGGRGTPGSTRGGRVTPGSRPTPGSGSRCGPSRGGSSSIVVRFGRRSSVRPHVRRRAGVKECPPVSAAPRCQQPPGPHHVSHFSGIPGLPGSRERLHAAEEP